jgi:hypothetical protein
MSKNIYSILCDDDDDCVITNPSNNDVSIPVTSENKIENTTAVAAIATAAAIARRSFDIDKPEIKKDDWESVQRHKTFKKREPYNNNYNNNNNNNNKRDMNIDQSYKKHFNNRFSDQNNIVIKKKVISAPTIKKTSVLELPSYYEKRSGTNEYEIPQNEYAWIRKIGGLEKSSSNENMFIGVIVAALSYFDNNDYINTNPYFKGKMSVNLEQQEDLLDMILIHTVSIMLHRLIKSDSCDIIKVIINSLPLYRLPLNLRGSDNKGVKYLSSNSSNALNVYHRLKNKWLSNQKIVSDYNKGNSQIDINEYNHAIDYLNKTTSRWNSFVLQSVWNGNNPIHDCLYYGANTTFKYLLSHYFGNGMKIQLNSMLLVPNIQNETHRDIVYNGKKACEAQSTYIIRKAQFEECEQLYNTTIEILRKELNSISEDEANSILAMASGVSTDISTNAVTIVGAKSDDTTNIIDMLRNQDIESMINYIMECYTNKQLDVIRSSIMIWKDIGETDSDLNDCVNDVLENKDLEHIFKEIR